MRSIGSLPDREDAELFQEYLDSIGIQAAVARDDNEKGFKLWVYDYDFEAQGRSERERFAALTDRTDIEQAVAAHRKKQKQKLQSDIHKRKRTAKMPRRATGPYIDQAPVTIALAAVCMTVGVLTLFGNENERVLNLVRITELTAQDSLHGDGTGWVRFSQLPEVASGQLWRLVAPIFGHSGPMHLCFNLLWLVPLGGAIEFRRGSLRFLGLVLTIAVISNLAQFTQVGPNFMGISGVVAGLFGYLLVVGKYIPEDGVGVDRRTAFMMLAYLVLCMTPLIPNVANWAHMVGLGVGAALAGLRVLLKRNRPMPA